jgi:hypothetical protein
VSEVQGLEPVTGNTPPPEVPKPEGGGTSTKPRSGFARQKLKVQRLTELYQNLLNDHDQLLSDYHRIESDYLALEAAFDEINQLNATLADELRRLKSQQRPAPVRYGMGLMGV